ncbi:SdrD B-like domain-containing protein [Geomobilimonas luticola]|uniref:OmpA family protein n=1 Tax=Geomobilimonas luticola TaxID=1114878 RepID=A0ABS5SD40_9BACT|nr:SdrD B-like domain-containing protein [Geomobilimonas luticola]MBT0653284.1 OmpA family protein [Geomobilimonas luticola]
MTPRGPGISLFRLCVILPLTLATTLLNTSVGSCLPPGGGSISLVNRYTDQGGTAASGSLNESLLRLDLYQTVPGYGRLFLSSDLSRNDSSVIGDTTSLSRYQIGLEGCRLGPWTTSFLAGDTSIRFTNLLEGFPGPFFSLFAVKPYMEPVFTTDDGRFLNATYPDVNFRGGVINSATDRNALLLFGGKLSNVRGFQSNEIQVTDESLVGAKWKHKWSDATYGGAGFIQTTDQPWQAGNPFGAKVNNSIFLLDGSYRLAESVRLMGEYRQNFYTLNGKSVNDWAMKAGPVVTLPHGTFELNYRRVGPDFLFVAENLQPERDVEGVFASLDYRPHQNLSVYTSFDWNRNNLENNTALPAIDTISALIGGYFFHPTLPSLNLRFSLMDKNSRAAIPTPTDSRGYNLYLETMKAYRVVTPYLRLQGEILDDAASPLNSAKTGTVTAGLRVTPLNNLNFYVEGEEQVRNADSGPTTTTVRTRGGITFIPLPNLSGYADGEFSTVKDNTTSGASQKNYSINGGVMITLPHQFYLNGDIRYNSSQIENFTSTNASILQFTLGLTRRFGWGEGAGGPVSGQGTGVALAEVGDIEGYVYQDLNHNGKRDPGEPGLPHVTVFLEDNSKAVTDKEGRYRFSNAAAGIHIVKLNERELDASINLLADASRRVEVKLRETTHVDYPVSYSGSLKGKVLIDANDNSVADGADTPLPDILVYLADSRTNTFSDADGNFALENLLPGRYEVRIDTTGLPEGTKLISVDRYTVEVRSGEELKDITFLVATEKKEIRKKVFGAGAPKAPATAPAAKQQEPAHPGKAGTTKSTGAAGGKGKKGVLPSTDASPKSAKPAAPVPERAGQQPSLGKGTETAAKERPLPSPAIKTQASVEAAEVSVVEVHFRPGSSTLTSNDEMATLATIARLANSQPDIHVALEGRTDQTGSVGFNRELGLKRAQAVADILTSFGLSREKIGRVRSFGPYGLICEKFTEDCFARNRRVVIRLFY